MLLLKIKFRLSMSWSEYMTQSCFLTMFFGCLNLNWFLFNSVPTFPWINFIRRAFENVWKLLLLWNLFTAVEVNQGLFVFDAKALTTKLFVLQCDSHSARKIVMYLVIPWSGLLNMLRILSCAPLRPLSLQDTLTGLWVEVKHYASWPSP